MINVNGEKFDDFWEAVKAQNEKRYSNLKEEGYEWCTNVLEDESETRYIKEIELKGLNYKIEEDAWDWEGNAILGAKVIFTKRRGQ